MAHRDHLSSHARRPRELVCHLSLLLAAERRLGTRKGPRALTCPTQAVIGLRWFRDRTDRAALGRDYGIFRATAYRYIDEAMAPTTPVQCLPLGYARCRTAAPSYVITPHRAVPIA